MKAVIKANRRTDPLLRTERALSQVEKTSSYLGKVKRVVNLVGKGTKYHQTYRELNSPDLRTELMAPWQAFNMLSQDLKSVTDLLPKKLQGPMGPFIQWPFDAAAAMDPFMQGLGDAQVELSRLVEESFSPLEQSIRNPGSLINLNRSPRDDDGLPKTW